LNFPTLAVYLLLLTAVFVPGRAIAEVDPGQPLTIVDPFIELHTGPAAAYPIFHVIDRGETVEVLIRKMNWYRVRSAGGVEGWVDRDQLQRTLQPDGAPVVLKEYGAEDFIRRDWELGVTTGELADAPILSVYGGYALMQNLSAEMTLGHSVGNVSSSTLLKLNLLMQPFPDWEYSPFFTLGMGRIEVDPSATLVDPLDQENEFAQIGFGFKTFLTRNFVFRAEVNEYVIFSASNDKDENEDISEWKLGFAVFF
jgi:hypothetical protein